MTKTAKKIPTKRVYICCPERDGVEKNLTRARLYCRFAFESGFVPVCPVIYFNQYLDENDKHERAAALRYGMDSMWQTSALWCFGSKITKSMEAEIELAKDLKITVKYYDSQMEALDEKR